MPAHALMANALAIVAASPSPRLPIEEPDTSEIYSDCADVGTFSVSASPVLEERRDQWHPYAPFLFLFAAL